MDKIKEKFNEIFVYCRNKKMRRTRALEQLLHYLLQHDSPLTLNQIHSNSSLRQLCDPTTVYRIILKLEQIGLVRRLGLHQREAYFILNLPERHKDYIVCESCSHIEEIHMACPVERLEQEVAVHMGYRHLYHELEFYGICPQCQKNQSSRSE